MASRTPRIGIVSSQPKTLNKSLYVTGTSVQGDVISSTTSASDSASQQQQYTAATETSVTMTIEQQQQDVAVQETYAEYSPGSTGDSSSRSSRKSRKSNGTLALVPKGGGGRRGTVSSSPVVKEQVTSKLGESEKDLVPETPLSSGTDPEVGLQQVSTTPIFSQNSPVPFDISTGINSSSPEIILFSDFTPIYDDEGKLTEFGKTLDIKQDAVLVCLRESILSLLGPENAAKFLRERANFNRENLLSFCKEFGTDISVLTNRCDVIKKRFDIRNEISKSTLDSFGLGLEASFGKPKDIKEILGGGDEVNDWTATKTWIQSCRQLKDTLKNGAVTSLLTDRPTANPGLIEDWNNPYKLVNSPTYYVNRFQWNQKQISGISHTIKNIRINFTIPDTGFSEAYDACLNIVKYQHFINEENTSSLSKRIAQLAYILSKEYTLSRHLMENMSSYQSIFSYPVGTNTAAKHDIWDYVIAEDNLAGNQDITDFPSNPKGRGRSMASFAQKSIATGGSVTEILTLEDKYVNDNIGSVRDGAVLTPGTNYFLESTLSQLAKSTNQTSADVSLSRLDSLVGHLGDIDKTLGLIMKAMPLEGSERAFSLQQRIVNNYATSPVSEDQKLRDEHFLSSPYSIIRTFEDYIIHPSGVIDKLLSYNPSILSELSDEIGLRVASGGVPLGNEALSYGDITPMLCAAAVKDPELSAMLFLYSVALMPTPNHPLFTAGRGTTELIDTEEFDAATREDLAKRIVERLLMMFPSVEETTSEDSYAVEGDNIVVDTQTIQPQMIIGVLSKANLRNDSLNIRSLHLFISLMSRLYEGTATPMATTTGTSLPWFMPNAGPGSEELTPYSGIQRTVYYAAFYQLFLTMMTSVNHRDFVGTKMSIKGGDNPVESKLLVYKISNPISRVINEKVQTVDGKILPSEIPPQGSPAPVASIVEEERTFRVLSYDEIIVDATNLVDEQYKEVSSHVNTMRMFVKELNHQTSEYRQSLASSKYNSMTSFIRSIVGANSASELLTTEQITLSVAKSRDMAYRLGEEYRTPLRDIKPYFLGFEKIKNFENLVPIEDCHVASWKIFLKNYFNKSEFYESQGWNKKIASVGIPKSLFRRMINSNINAKRNSLFKLKIFRIDKLRPYLIHLPLVYTFDMMRFPPRTLGAFFASERQAQEDLLTDGMTDDQKFPMYEPKESTSTDVKLASDFSTSFSSYDFLKTNTKREIYENHKMSFYLEEYIQFITDQSVNENRYYKMAGLKDVSQKALNANSIDTMAATPSFERIFAKDTLFSMNLTEQQRAIITPKKFDRVFHVMFDPDDFYVDSEMTDMNLILPGGPFHNDVTIVEQSDETNQTVKVKSYKRRSTAKNEVTFDQYFAQVETYDEGV